VLARTQRVLLVAQCVELALQLGPFLVGRRRGVHLVGGGEFVVPVPRRLAALVGQAVDLRVERVLLAFERLLLLDERLLAPAQVLLLGLEGAKRSEQLLRTSQRRRVLDQVGHASPAEPEEVSRVPFANLRVGVEVEVRARRVLAVRQKVGVLARGSSRPSRA
jgi:hypothetical protein